MAKFKVQAKREDIDKAGEDQGEFVVPKPGFYHLRIAEANAGFSKTNGEEDKSKPRIEVVYEIVGEGMNAAKPDANYGRIWDYVTFGDGYAATRRVEFTMALYPNVTEEQIENGDVELDTDELLERVLIARLKHEKDKRKSEEEKKVVNRARVATVMPLDAADGYSDAEVDDDAYGSEAADEEATDDPFAEGEEEATEDGLLTEEELDGHDLKELGAIAKEFDLDPNDFLVKYKSGANKGKLNAGSTKKAVIAAILESQGSNDEGEGGDDGDDENPF